ncbi:hypothetical protein [Bdellovibrio svalbardensis]|uniref:Uncharacterized protein n=1 Tax=Bdellovibrio svalbardensis TaxID=2972972 RepID=A0ABT6DJY0_9BACT|nr:hypothetical protein [Bdellovibrio svalbardensis]MDG0815403.1 hypothetical protein [Bdellovibrio svalbardensis]
MKTFKALLIASILTISSTSLAVPKGFSEIRSKEIQEDDVTFRYMSNDGTFDLKCAHVYDKPGAWDWDVWCGKGTNMLKMFRVHFLVRQYKAKAAEKTGFEILYWVIDRNQPATKAFSSTSTWLQFNSLTDPEVLSFSQGVENDYAYLTLEYKPGR